MTLCSRLELCASALHPVAMTLRLVETRLLVTVLPSASIHSDDAEKKGHSLVFRHKFQEKRGKLAVAAKVIYYSALNS